MIGDRRNKALGNVVAIGLSVVIVALGLWMLINTFVPGRLERQASARFR